MHLLTSLPLHLLLLDRCSIVVHLNRQVLLCIISSLTRMVSGICYDGEVPQFKFRCIHGSDG